MDKIGSGSKIRGTSEGGEIESNEIGDIGLSCCQLCVSAREAKGEYVYIASIFVQGRRFPYD